MEEFIRHAKAVAHVLQAKTMRDLLAISQVAFKQIFKCLKVNFLFQDKEIVELLTKEGAVFRQITHCHEKFEVYIPDGIRMDQMKFTAKFTNITDVKKGEMYQSHVCVAPVNKMRFPDQVIMLIQLEHLQGSPITFEKLRDRQAFKIMTKILSSIFERILVSNRTTLSQDRAYRILNTFSLFMGKKQHATLCESFERKFPALFNFEKCALLFIDAANGSLFKFHSADQEQKDKAASL